MNISKIKCLVFLTLKNTRNWLTSNEIAEKTGINKRTVRHNCLELTKLNVIECVEMQPCNHYRYKPLNKEHLTLLNNAIKLYGL
jgi:predicted transcriptional regulator